MLTHSSSNTDPAGATLRPGAGSDVDVVVCEVGPRDGLQMVDALFPTRRKLDWIRAEAAAGVREIEVTSLVPPRIGPQFGDAAAAVGAALAVPGLRVMGLVPNLKGAERGIELGLHTLNFVMSVSRTHNLKNVRRERDDSLVDFRRIAELLATLPADRRPRLLGGLSTAMGCSYEGAIPVDDVLRYAAALAEAGADEIMVADTVGHADPVSVRRLFKAVMAEVHPLPVAAHFHDTRGLGLANVVAALECGVRRFDASLGGLGGCQFAPGASGNIVMEDLCFLLDAMGLRTGVDLERLIAVRQIVVQGLQDTPLLGALAKAGLPTGYTSPRQHTAS